MSRNYKETTIKSLFARSGNRCAFPGCNVPIVEDEDNIVTGEICHIEAESANGPRFNRTQTKCERNSFENLVLMCPRHHKIIDSNEVRYTVDVLKEWKKNHELKVSEEQHFSMNEIQKKIEVESETFWKSINEIDDTDETGFKRKVEEKSVKDLLSEIEEIFELLENNCKCLADEDDKAMLQLEQLCKLAGVDFGEINKVFYKDNPFVSRNWETHCLAIPNALGQLKMEYFQLIVLLLERITKNDYHYEPLLDIYRNRFKEYQSMNYYVD